MIDVERCNVCVKYVSYEKGSGTMRRNDGRETWFRLLEWDKGQTPAERLAAIILTNEGFRNIDPSHPLGGKDGLKDMVISYNGARWVGAVYFPRGQQDFSVIKNKFIHDLKGVKKNGANGIAFITNQELRLAERKDLSEIDTNVDVQIYHLERIASLLNSPQYYGVRMEFLDMEMNKEEQMAFFASQTDKMNNIENVLARLVSNIENTDCKHRLLEKRRNTEDEEFDEDLKYFDEPRSIEEIVEATEEFLDKIWFDRHLSLRYRIETGVETVDSEIWKGALQSAQRVIEKYGEENLGPYSDFEWGMLNGKLSALRWVLGDEWDMLDT
mgnify:FL=1